MFLSCKHSANLREIAHCTDINRSRPSCCQGPRYWRWEYYVSENWGNQIFADYWNNSYAWIFFYQKWKPLDLNRVFEEKWSSWANHSECCKGTVVTSLPWYIVFFSPEPAQQCQLVLSSFGLFTLLVFSLSFSFHFYFLYTFIFFSSLFSSQFYVQSFSF